MIGLVDAAYAGVARSRIRGKTPPPCRQIHSHIRIICLVYDVKVGWVFLKSSAVAEPTTQGQTKRGVQCRDSTAAALAWLTNEECIGSSNLHPRTGARLCVQGWEEEGRGRLFQLGQCHGRTTWTTSYFTTITNKSGQRTLRLFPWRLFLCKLVPEGTEGGGKDLSRQGFEGGTVGAGPVESLSKPFLAWAPFSPVCGSKERRRPLRTDGGPSVLFPSLPLSLCGKWLA